MKLRWHTFGGLVLVAAAGCAVAFVFQRRSPDVAPLAASRVSAENSFGSAGRGRIVPLVVEDDMPPAAFVPATPASGADAGWGARSQLQSLPTIRASAGSEMAAPPDLPSAFPLPTELEPLSAPESIDRAPIASPTIAAKPAIVSPARHRVVDGDTLPALAERYLGDASRATEIYEQNRSLLSSPDVLPIGVELVIGE